MLDSIEKSLAFMVEFPHTFVTYRFIQPCFKLTIKNNVFNSYISIYVFI